VAAGPVTLPVLETFVRQWIQGNAVHSAKDVA